jgi:ATP-dependent RNA helicase SUPV3L1/SUV3
LIADEHLTGAPRDSVETRLGAWLKSYIEKLLGPLMQLAGAEDVTGIARGVAFQLIESLGVLDRQRVAEDVKGLEQPARATLRKYGVRFGAYHIYLPALLKPVPRALAAQLWALRNEAQIKGIDELLPLAGSGRTSFPVNREIDAALYRVAGYRVCGERAVRVDILERLADLIRPALAWRGNAGPKPPGSVAGGGFTVVNGMTSLTGASGEDFASILRSLGYRMERRPKPAEPPAPAEETAGAAEAAPQAESGLPAESAFPIESASPIEASADIAAAEPEVADQAPPAMAVEAPDATGQADEATAAPIEDTESVVQPAADEANAANAAVAAEAPDPSSAAAGSAATDSAEPAEPIMIEVWRPGRPEGVRRPRHKDRERRHHGRRPLPAAAAPSPQESPATAVTASEPAATVGPGDTLAKPDIPAREGRPPRHRRRQSEHRADRPPRERERPPVKRFERREKAPDPNSPFAKLAALKAQLEADAKERR